jgi:tetratricopeptide (TPR) repeat protein
VTEATDPVAAPRPERPAIHRVDRIAVVIAFLVATVSIVSAVVAGRAAVWSSNASDIDSLVLQESIEREQLQNDLDLSAAADVRYAARYDAAQQEASGLRDKADTIRADDPAGAARADLGAQSAWAVDQALWRYFQAAFPAYGPDGALLFDARSAAEAQAAADPRLSELLVSQTPARASAARDHTLTLVGIAVLFVAALFTLTLAEVWPGRGRWAPLLVALAMAAGAMAVTVAVEPETALLIAGIVAVAAVALALALVGLARREREEERRVAAGGTPREPDPEGGSTRFRGTVAVVLATATLLGASVGYLQGRASDAGAAATHRAQDQALLALAEHQRTMAWTTTQVEVWSIVEEHRARAIGTRQLAAYLDGEGDAAGAAVAREEADRHDALASAAGGLTALSDEHADGPNADPAFPYRFLQSQGTSRAARVALQDLANEANAVWGGQAAAYVAVLATIAIAAYLLGLSLVLRTRRLRALFAVTGGLLVVVAVGAGGLTALAPQALPSVPEQAAISVAFARASLLDQTARTPAQRTAAVEAWQKVVELHPTLARAHVKLASARFDEGSPQTTGYTSIATIEATRAALAELETAAALGWDDLGTRGDAGFYRFLVGLSDPASGASAQAVEDALAALELGPDLPVVRFNLGAALLAAGRIEEAQAAYARAVEAVTAVAPDGDPVFSDGERSDVSSGALTDIELIAAARAEDAAIIAAIPAIRTAIVRGMSDPVKPEAAGSPARVSDLELVANPSEIWWQARIDDFDAARDVLAVVWLQEDPKVPGWHVLGRHSGPLRLGESTVAGGFYANGAAPDYYGSQGYLFTSDPSSCVPDGRYRVELYLNGELAAEPVTEELDMPELATERRTDLGLLFCRPSTWTEGTSEPGMRLDFADASGDTVMWVSRTFRPDPDGDEGAAEVKTVMDALAADWDPSSVAIGAETVPTYFIGLDSAQVQWYDSADARLKVVAGATSFGTVIAAAFAGTADWVDSDEVGNVINSFLQQ